MKKLFFSLSLSLLFLTSIGLLKPGSVLAAEGGGPAGKLMLRASSGPNAGEITLRWGNADSADNYHLVFGTNPKSMKYGALNIGKSNVYTVGKLNPGTKYYFALVPVVNNMALYTSEWVSAFAKSGQVTSVTPVTSVKTVTSVTPVVKSTTRAADKHWLIARSGPNEGEVTLNWRHADDANNYHLVYGTEHGKFKYGVLNIGWVTSYTVKKLVPGVTYHFALVPVKNDVALYTSDQVMAAARRNVQMVQTTKEAVMQPKIIIPVTDTSTVPGTVLPTQASISAEPTSVSSQ